MPKATFLNLAQEKKDLITDALIKHFATKPYHLVDISDVAKECRVAKGSMYQYFENKKDMYFYTIEVAYERFLQLLTKMDMVHVNILDYYENSLESVWNAMKDLRYEYMLLEMAFFSHDSPFKDEINEKFLKQSRDFLVEIIKYNQKQGFIRDDIDPLLIGIFLEGASFYMKKFIIEKALNENNTTTFELDIDYFKDAISQFIKLLKEGIAKK
ncbi:transcriptional regulator, TetR family [Thermoanaerobacter thermohydrosulfuricus]|uniref:Transcriptional regulator n=3 Tax=Thermoanaerobacter thermohydrosulfuricus TaxID=1516 RepID=M8CW28_THETY|nr:TetR/AcrR family transcriptional regulator [Thermoanaerobacter thermohydrosulfuricus]EGD51865.1 regulatory protein TetR [Thermoanaerobacter ethanolicus JW 200]EMT38604.1 Transcriptional regulator [Thermoanaerobacter thermohydrosulfuricus WC1]SDG43429.1 transcriptional regulator, TetR family [Thermoanaerobacter thermohydrosulfuricus]